MPDLTKLDTVIASLGFARSDLLEFRKSLEPPPPPPLTLARLALPEKLEIGKSASGLVSLSAKATTAVEVKILDTPLGLIRVPATVVIAAGEQSATFEISVEPRALPLETVSIVARLNDSSLLQQLTIVAPVIKPPVPAVNDFTIRNRPDVPAPAKGSWFTDPTFGGRILRVTSGLENDISYRTPGAGFPWSADSKQFSIVDSHGQPRLFDWTGEAATYAGTIPIPSEVTFDQTDPDTVYGIGYRGPDGTEAVVRRYNIRTKALTDVIGVREIVKDVDAIDRTYARGLGAAGGRFWFLFGGGAQDLDHYIWVAPLATPRDGVLVDTKAKFGFLTHQIMGDLSGRFITIGARGQDTKIAGAPNLVWNVDANTFTPMSTSGGGHCCWGSGELVNNPDDFDSLEYRWRRLDEPNTTRLLFDKFPAKIDANKYVDSHLAFVRPRHSVIVARYRFGDGIFAPWRAGDDEILELSIDTGIFRRLAHHQSIVAAPTNTPERFDYEYWYSPKPNVSPDGTAAPFTSNWRRTLGTNIGDGGRRVARQDVFILKLTT